MYDDDSGDSIDDVHVNVDRLEEDVTELHRLDRLCRDRSRSLVSDIGEVCQHMIREAEVLFVDSKVGEKTQF